MAKKKYTPEEFERQHLRNQYARAQAIMKMYEDAMAEASRIVASGVVDPNKAFYFDDYPSIKKRIDELMNEVNNQLLNTIESGNPEEWDLSALKNDAMVDSLVASTGIPQSTIAQWKQPNLSALTAFQQRKIEGMKLSQRVWNLTDQFRQELELALDLGIGEGKSADRMSRDVRRYLRNPDKLFRRVRDKHGNLRLSKAAKAYHPGRGVYRSSYRNALRLTATENNMAYRTADHLRWQQMPFVIGIEIKLSNNHTCKGVIGRFVDICDDLAGVYPKEFKFVGWHPHCRCFAIAKMASAEECNAYFDRLEAGEDVSNYEFSGKVKELPQNFQNWHTDNADRIAKAKSQPYFLRDNAKLIEKAVVKSSALTPIVELLNSKGIEYNKVSMFDKQPTEKQIIERVGGGDLTSGSCASVGLAYIANTAGMNVLDFRGGESMKWFMSRLNLKQLTKSVGAIWDYTTGMSLVKKAEIGKQYYCVFAQHAAIVRQVEKGKFQYLELQSGKPDGNGWKELNSKSFKRFGKKGKSICTLCDIELIKADPNFKKLMGYINTNSDKQKKGKLGTIK